MAGETILNGRYELVAQQGSGGMSVIYKAIDRALGRTVAIKILRPSLTQDPAFLDKFRQEARSVAKLSHPNIVTVHDVGNDGPTHYIVMELVEGQDLKKIIKAQGALPVGRALDLGIQLCAGIGFAHRSNLVHADIKPQNVLLTTEDVVKVTDFGIAQAFSDTMPQTRQDVVWGSPHYFAPEQAKGEKPTPASDVYAIGIVIFEMLTGRLPYVGASQQELALAHIRSDVPKASEVSPNVPEALSKIIFKVMSKNPTERYRMADQLGHVLKSYRDRARDRTVDMPSAPPSPANQAPRPAPPNIPPPNLRPTPNPSAEPTARYSAAPNAPTYNDPYKRNSGSNVTSQPQPLQQNYMPNTQPGYPPRPQPQGQPLPPQMSQDSRRMYPQQYSGQQYVDEPEAGTDWVTIILAVLAVIALLGLCPLYLLGVFPNL